jgi:CBS domain-containing protein
MLPVQRTIVPDVIRAQKLVTLTGEASVRQATLLMAERGVGAVMVVEELQLVGIFTERDVSTRVVAAGLDPDATRLGQVMTPDPDTLKPTATVRDALDLMKMHGYRHLPVVQGRKLVGIVSIRDLYNTVMDQLEADILLLAEGLIHG